MTLLELLVVVAILAVLATVAIQSTTDIGNQTRYEVTQKSLASFRDAALGPANQTSPDGNAMITGFIADMGRPPRSRELVHPELGTLNDLSELYAENLPGSLKTFGLYSATTANLATNATISGLSSTALLYDSALRIPAGWRGPYLRKPSTELSLVDGWGKLLVSRLDLGSTLPEINSWPTMLLAFRTNTTSQPFALAENVNYTAVTDAGRDVVGLFTQSGFNGAPVGTDAYSGRFYSAITTNEYRIPITITVNCSTLFTPLAATNYVAVMLYGPNPDVASDGKPIRVWAQQANYTSFNVTFTFDNANAPTVGTRVVRAILRLSGSRFEYSRVVYFPIRPGVQNINIPLP